MHAGTVRSLSALFLIFLAGTARATVFHIDEFTVTKDEAGVPTVLFQDTFSDGSPPQTFVLEDPAPVDVNPTGRAYLTGPFPALPGPETGGLLALDTADGVFNFSPVNQVANLVQGAQVLTSQVDDDAALWRDDQFRVEGVFDLTIPQLDRERFGVRLTDFQPGSRNEDLEMVFGRRGDGEVRVFFRQADIPNNRFDVLQQWNPTQGANFLDYETIVLALFNDTLNTEMFSASFTLVDQDGVLPDITRVSTSQGSLFQVSDWVRPEFFVDLTFSVPAPPSLALVALGLAGMARRGARLRGTVQSG